MKSLFSTAAVLALALVFATPALAEGDGEKSGKGGCKKRGQAFAKFDTDKSGTLTSDEVPAKLWTRLSKADADGDGAVSKAEARKAGKKRGKRGRKGGKRGRKGGKGSQGGSSDA